jgi:hypothetical protein
MFYHEKNEKIDEIVTEQIINFFFEVVRMQKCVFSSGKDAENVFGD